MLTQTEVRPDATSLRHHPTDTRKPAASWWLVAFRREGRVPVTTAPEPNANDREGRASGDR